MKTSKVDSNRIVVGIKRLIKFIGLGSKDVQEVRQLAPFGIDSAPIKDMVAVYSETGVKGESVVLGYFNRSLLADSGEFRTYSVDSNGEVKFYIWQKKNGTCEIGGNTHNLVRYTPLNSGLQAFITDLKAELLLIQTGIIAGGGTYTPTPTLGININGSKIDEIKTL